MSEPTHYYDRKTGRVRLIRHPAPLWVNFAIALGIAMIVGLEVWAWQISSHSTAIEICKIGGTDCKTIINK